MGFTYCERYVSMLHYICPIQETYVVKKQKKCVITCNRKYKIGKGKSMPLETNFRSILLGKNNL